MLNRVQVSEVAVVSEFRVESCAISVAILASISLSAKLIDRGTKVNRLSDEGARSFMLSRC